MKSISIKSNLRSAVFPFIYRVRQDEREHEKGIHETNWEEKTIEP